MVSAAQLTVVAAVAALAIGVSSGEQDFSTCICAPNLCNASAAFNLTEIMQDETLTHIDCFNLPGPQTIPENVGNLVELTELALYSSGRLTGTIPSSVGMLEKLTELVIYDNHNLRGTVPTELGNLRNLTSLELDINLHLTGTIPSELGNLVKLTNL